MEEKNEGRRGRKRGGETFFDVADVRTVGFRWVAGVVVEDVFFCVNFFCFGFGVWGWGGWWVWGLKIEREREKVEMYSKRKVGKG